MKLLAFLTIVAVFSHAAAGTPEQDKMFEQLLSKCSAKEEASSDDVARLINRDLPTTPAGNCLQACIMENVGLISGGKPSVEGAVAMAVASGAEASKIANSKEVAEECSSITDPDRCTLALKVMECSVKASVARGLDPKHLLD